jgi:hypothetical protein
LALETSVKKGHEVALEHPFFQAMAERMSRRFPVGCSISVPEGKFESKNPPVPLDEEEEALLVWAATGIVGQNLHDTSPVEPGYCMQLHWSRRTWPSSGAAHCTQLFVVNDKGISYIDVRGVDADKINDDFASATKPEDRIEAAVKFYRDHRKMISNRRSDIPNRFPVVWKSNEWFFNKAGTTLFIPVTDFTIEYLNVLSFLLGDGWRITILDDFHGNRPAGLEQWVKKGVLSGAVTLPLRLLEVNGGLAMGAEQGFMLQNVGLACQALGLGGFAFAGHIPQVLMGGTPLARGLGFKFVTPTKEPKNPYPVGREDVLKIFHPYYYKGSVEEMVRDFFGIRRKKFDQGTPKPFKDPENWLQKVNYPSEDDIQMVVDCVKYVWDTFGRFPALLEPISTRIRYQAHHLELGFYDKYYGPQAYTENIKAHFVSWHPGSPVAR